MMRSADLRDAAAAFHSGRLEEAEMMCRRRLDHDPGDLDARHLLGLVLARRGALAEAIAEVERVARERPGDSEIRRNLALICREAGDPEAARSHYLALSQLLPEAARPRVGAAEMAIELGLEAEAESDLEAALAVERDHPDALATLAQLAEQRNEDERARELAQKALCRSPEHFKAAFTLARLATKAGELDQADATLQQLARQRLSPINRALVMGRLAQLDDRRGRYQQAFARFETANRTLGQTAQAAALAGTSVYGRQTVAELSEFFDRERLAAWADGGPSSDRREPVFLVGFPRSGTTLLDRMLAAHPDVAVIEERPMLAPVLDRYAQGPDSLRAFEQLEAEELSELADSYLEGTRQAVGERPLVIDKLPLNTVFLAMIHRIFPRARILFSLRDPRDVCLSCFFQTFGLNEAMSYFLDWESTGRYYAEVMGLGLRYLDHLPVRCRTVRYEALVNDPLSEIRPVLAFLSLDWDDRVVNHHRHVPGKRIDTPSYDQVSQPVYRGSVGRWRNYEAQISRIETVLAPFVERFGYG